VVKIAAAIHKSDLGGVALGISTRKRHPRR